MRKLALIAASLSLASCTHSPIVSDFKESPTDPSAGAVAPLSQAIANSDNVVLVTIHGVGDHCPGYALRNGGWINNPVARKYGLVPVDGSLQKRIDILAGEFMPHGRMDANSKVSYMKAEFVHAPTGKSVTAIEITWSQLTQWIKTVQLGFDTTTTPRDASDGFEECFYAIPDDGQDFSYSKSPPDRVAINRVVKESILNRKLSDAVLYVGNYGPTIQRGVAEAMCRALGGAAHLGPDGKPDGQLCEWPNIVSTVPEGTRFIFITHSLGSRALYDTLLGLSGDRVNPGILIFSNDGAGSEVARSRDIACRMIGHTAAIYMMANQLAMLGLAYHDGKSTSEDGPQPYDVRNTLPIRGCGHRTPVTEDIARRVDPEAVTSAPVVNVFSEIWDRAREEEGLSSTSLTIVSFNDTNDLLTWNLPRWYTIQSAGKTLPVQATNVFVTNGTRWLGLFQDPASAHSGYFTNHHVWSVMTCGATNGKVNTCL